MLNWEALTNLVGGFFGSFFAGRREFELSMMDKKLEQIKLNNKHEELKLNIQLQLAEIEERKRIRELEHEERKHMRETDHELKKQTKEQEFQVEQQMRKHKHDYRIVKLSLEATSKPFTNCGTANLFQAIMEQGQPIHILPYSNLHKALSLSPLFSNKLMLPAPSRFILPKQSNKEFHAQTSHDLLISSKSALQEIMKFEF